MKGYKYVAADTLKQGDVVEITWVDTQGLDRQRTEDIRKLPELQPTRSYGVVVRKMKTSIVIAHEIGDLDSDGWYVEQLSLGMITCCRLFGHTEVTLED